MYTDTYMLLRTPSFCPIIF